MEQKKKTVGAASSELLIKALEKPATHTVEEQMREQLTDYEKNVIEATEIFKKAHPNKDFYVVVLSRAERLMHNVKRLVFFGRHSCPTPDYDQTVYRYSHERDDLDFIWVIPDKPACIFYMQNALHLLPEEKELARFVFDFRDGTLGKLAAKLNKEENLVTNIIITEGTA